jgi:hypothetical protein
VKTFGFTAQNGHELEVGVVGVDLAAGRDYTVVRVIDRSKLGGRSTVAVLRWDGMDLVPTVTSNAWTAAVRRDVEAALRIEVQP